MTRDAEMLVAGLDRLCGRVERCLESPAGAPALYVAAARFLVGLAPDDAVADYLPWYRQVKRLHELARRAGPLCVSTDEREAVESTAEQALSGRAFDPLDYVRIRTPEEQAERCRSAVLPRFLSTKESTDDSP